MIHMCERDPGFVFSTQWKHRECASLFLDYVTRCTANYSGRIQLGLLGLYWVYVVKTVPGAPKK